MKLVPMGTYIKNSKEVKIDAFWISNEVTNKEYRTFLESLKENLNDSIGIIDLKKIKAGIDLINAIKYYSYSDILKDATTSEVWNSDEGFDNYLYSKQYDNYPAVGVSFENAVLYCAWKTKEFNKLQKEKGLPYIPSFRLPSEGEWEWAALGGKHESDMVYTPKLGNVNSESKNIYGLYHLNGNVSEWILNEAENGKRVIKGSSWKKEMSLFERDEQPKNFRDNATGFRVVMSHMAKKPR